MAQPRHWIVLGALALGISLGAWIDHSGSELAHSVASGIEAIGTLWLNALRMTVGTEEENLAVLDALKAFLGATGAKRQ